MLLERVILLYLKMVVMLLGRIILVLKAAAFTKELLGIRIVLLLRRIIMLL